MTAAAQAERKEYHIGWIPLFCARIMKDEMSCAEIEGFVGRARAELHGHLKKFHRGAQIHAQVFLTREERKAVLAVEMLRDRELMGYYRALHCLEKYARSSRKSFIIGAKRHYQTAEETWKRLVLQMREFVLLSLAGRRPMPMI